MKKRKCEVFEQNQGDETVSHFCKVTVKFMHNNVMDRIQTAMVPYFDSDFGQGDLDNTGDTQPERREHLPKVFQIPPHPMHNRQ